MNDTIVTYSLKTWQYYVLLHKVTTYLVYFSYKGALVTYWLPQASQLTPAMHLCHLHTLNFYVNLYSIYIITESNITSTFVSDNSSKEHH